MNLIHAKATKKTERGISPDNRRWTGNASLELLLFPAPHSMWLHWKCNKNMRSTSIYWLRMRWVQGLAMQTFRLMYPHIGSLVGLFRLCGHCSAPHLSSTPSDTSPKTPSNAQCNPLQILSCELFQKQSRDRAFCAAMRPRMCCHSGWEQSRCTSGSTWRRCGRTACATGVRWAPRCSSSSWASPTPPPPPSSSLSPSSISSPPGEGHFSVPHAPVSKTHFPLI